MTLADFAQLGSNGMLAFFVWRLWVRLETVTDRLFRYLETGAAEREAIAEAVGLDTQDLTRARRAAIEKREAGNNPI